MTSSFRVVASNQKPNPKKGTHGLPEAQLQGGGEGLQGTTECPGDPALTLWAPLRPVG